MDPWDKALDSPSKYWKWWNPTFDFDMNDIPLPLAEICAWCGEFHPRTPPIIPMSRLLVEARRRKNDELLRRRVRETKEKGVPRVRGMPFKRKERSSAAPLDDFRSLAEEIAAIDRQLARDSAGRGDLATERRVHGDRAMHRRKKRPSAAPLEDFGSMTAEIEEIERKVVTDATERPTMLDVATIGEIEAIERALIIDTTERPLMLDIATIGEIEAIERALIIDTTERPLMLDIATIGEIEAIERALIIDTTERPLMLDIATIREFEAIRRALMNDGTERSVMVDIATLGELKIPAIKRQERAEEMEREEEREEERRTDGEL